MPFYATAMVFRLNTYLSYHLPQQVQWMLLALVFVSTFVFPVLFASFMVQKGMVGSLTMENQHERKIPFIATILFYFIAFFLVRRFPLPGFFSLIILGSALVVVLAFLINLKWKISIHTMGTGGMCGLVYWLTEIQLLHSVIPFVLLILVSGIVGTARLISGSHTQLQIYVGYFIGFATLLLVMKLRLQ